MPATKHPPRRKAGKRPRPGKRPVKRGGCRGVDDVTLAWIRNLSDESAIRNGCRFHLRKAVYAVWWMERFCRLYEGEQAGQPLVLRGCHRCGDYGLAIPETFDAEGEKICLKRAARYARCVAAGHELDWQYECTMRVFGWVHFSKQFNRNVRRFRQASIWVPKKNKKTPTMSAWGLYLLAGDDEPGQKVFLAAKDGMQVRKNGARHAVEMVLQSPALLAECRINKVEMQITHDPSRSVMTPLSSSNERTAKSKEGLNGSLLVDETHVVDRDFMSRVDRAGISRAEPLHAEFSTSGDDPESYGKERFDRAMKVQRGAIEDQGLFVAIYAAPQDVKDEELRRDPLKFGRMANPAWGHTIDPDEFLDDFEKSKDSPRKLAAFKMYRLDVWQNAASPWLNSGHWAQGIRDLRLEDFHGRECYSALDLASVKDFASLCLCFPELDDAYAFFWWYWLPAHTAEEYADLISIADWKADSRCRLTLTEGARTDYGHIEGTFRDLSKLFQIQEIAYDDWNAEQTTQTLHEGKKDNNGRIVIPGTGIPRVDFSQGMKSMNEPSKRFEADVIDGKILHNGDPLTTWMAGNATIKPDINNNYKPIKPRGINKIDGIVAAIMCRYRASLGNQQTTIYEREDRGFRSIG